MNKLGAKEPLILFHDDMEWEEHPGEGESEDKTNHRYVDFGPAPLERLLRATELRKH